MHAQCKILNNLALSIARQADLIEDPQARAAEGGRSRIAVLAGRWWPWSLARLP